MFPDGIFEMPHIENPVFRRMRVGVDFDHVDAEEFIRCVFREIRFRRTDEHCLFFCVHGFRGRSERGRMSGHLPSCLDFRENDKGVVFRNEIDFGVQEASGKNVCSICGYVYEGEPLPEDFVCPLCGHGAEDFEKAR